MKKVIKMNEEDIEKIVKKVLKEEPTDDFSWDEVLGNSADSKWDNLERDLHSCLEPLIEKYADDFGKDSYAVIDAIYQVLDGMFQKV
jgi:hypothetical protein